MKFSLIKMVFRRYRKIMVSMVMIAALAVALVNGMFNACESLDITLKAYLTEYGIADASISADITDTEAAEKIRQVDGVANVLARLTGSSQVVTPSGNMLTAQIISMDKEDFLRMYHWEESQEPDGNYVLSDYWFALNNGISVGDVLQIRTGEDEYRPFTVAAVVSAPETLERTKLNLGGRYYPDFGFLYAPISLLETETEKEKGRMTAEWKEKEAEYLKAEKEFRESWDEGQAELTKAREELETQEKEFEEKRAELRDQIRELTEGRVRLILGRKELADAEGTAEERKKELEEQLDRVAEQLLETEDTQAELTEVRNDLSSLLVQMENAKGRLAAARDLITKKEGEVVNKLQALKTARTLWQQARSADTLIDISAVEDAVAARGFTSGDLDKLISLAEDGMSQMVVGKNRIQNGIVEINNNYLPEIQAYLEETEQGLEALTEIHTALQDGIAEMEAGLKSIAEFEQEAPDNREEINRKLREYIDGGDDPAEDDPDEGGKEPVSEIVEMVVTSENGKPVKMRAQPDPKCEIWDKIEIGTIVEVLDGGRATYCAGSAWIHIKAGGKKGWMMEEFLEEMPDGGDDDFDPGDLDPDDGEPQDEDEEVTITMTLGEAREILEKLEMMADILAMKIGRG